MGVGAFEFKSFRFFSVRFTAAPGVKKAKTLIVPQRNPHSTFKGTLIVPIQDRIFTPKNPKKNKRPRSKRPPEGSVPDFDPENGEVVLDLLLNLTLRVHAHYYTIMELGPKRPSPLWFWGLNSIIVVYMKGFF